MLEIQRYIPTMLNPKHYVVCAVGPYNIISIDQELVENKLFSPTPPLRENVDLYFCVLCKFAPLILFAFMHSSVNS